MNILSVLIENSIKDILQDLDGECMQMAINIIEQRKKAEFIKTVASEQDSMFDKTFLEEL